MLLCAFQALDQSKNPTQKRYLRGPMLRPTVLPARWPLAVIAILVGAVSACAPVSRRIVGALVYDGMPNIPDDPRARPYF